MNQATTIKRRIGHAVRHGYARYVLTQPATHSHR